MKKKDYGIFLYGLILICLGLFLCIVVIPFINGEKKDYEVIIDIFTFISILAGAFWAIYQWSQYKRQLRTDYLIGVMERMRTNENISKMLYKVEYGNFKYCPCLFRGSDDEKALDSILFQIGTISYMKKKNFLAEDEYAIFGYIIESILKDQNVYAYLSNLQNILEGEGKKYPFTDLLQQSMVLHEKKPAVICGCCKCDKKMNCKELERMQKRPL